MPHSRQRFAFLLSFLSGLILGACEKSLPWRMPPQILEHIPFTPLYVEEGVQTVYLSAFLGDLSRVDSITSSQGYQLRWVKGADTVLLRTNTNAAPLGKLRFWSGGYAYTLPLIRKYSYTHTFRLDDPQQRLTSVNLHTTFSEPRAMRFQNGSWTFETRVPEGIHAYRFQSVDGKLFKDPVNTDSIFWPGLGMSSLVPLEQQEARQNACRTIAFTGTQIRLSRDPQAAAVLALWDNIEIPFDTADGTLRIEIPKAALKVPVSYLRVWLYNQNRIVGSCKIPLVKGKVPVDTAAIPPDLWDAAVRYELITDRFNNGDPGNDRKLSTRGLLHPKVDFHGGDFAGIAQKIREGYFRELGISFLRISPPARNVSGYWPDASAPHNLAAPYQGRYAVSVKETEPGFGSAGALKQLIDLAKASDLQVGLEPPSIWWMNDAAQQPVSPDSALQWFRSFNAAAWMHPVRGETPSHTAAVSAAVRRFDAEEGGRNILLALEDSNVPNRNNASLQSAAQAFQSPDFYAMAFTTFAYTAGRTSRAGLLELYAQSLNNLQLRFHSTGGEWYPRFISLADGSLHPAEDLNKAGWARDIQNQGAKYFNRLQSLFALCCALPGIPGMFYGDEMAMPGAGVPDNHRVIHFEGLSSVQTDHRDQMARLAKFRRTHPVLMFGDMRVMESEPGLLIIERQYFGRTILAVFNLTEQTASFKAQVSLNRSLNGSKLQPDKQGVIIQTEPNSYDFIY